MSRPVIGITGYTESASWGSWQGTATLLPINYVDKLTAAGALPVVLPPIAEIASRIDVFDGLVLAGGGDIDPARYGAVAHPATESIRPDRDETELRLTMAALERGVPLLGICRGMQVLNVARGGTLYQHVPDVVGHEEHSGYTGAFGHHEVRIEPGSQIAKVLDSERLTVPTHHHQSVDKLGSGMVASAWSDDGLAEAVEFEDHPFVVAVQWHPEAGDDLSLFDALVEAAAGGR